MFNGEMSSDTIRKKLEAFFPPIEFQKYTRNEVSFHNNAGNKKIPQMFTLNFEGLHELRPSIMKGLLGPTIDYYIT